MEAGTGPEEPVEQEDASRWAGLPPPPAPRGFMVYAGAAERGPLRINVPERLMIGSAEIVVGVGERQLHPRLRVRRGESVDIALVGRRPGRFSEIWIRGPEGGVEVALRLGDRTQIAPVLELFGWPYRVVWG